MIFFLFLILCPQFVIFLLKTPGHSDRVVGSCSRSEPKSAGQGPSDRHFRDVWVPFVMYTGIIDWHYFQNSGH